MMNGNAIVADGEFGWAADILYDGEEYSALCVMIKTTGWLPIGNRFRRRETSAQRYA